MEATVIAKLIVNEIFCRHGAPKTLLSDRDKNFLSKLIREVCNLLSIKKLNTTAYHPQTDGLVERFNSVISQSLSMYVSANQKDWGEFLPSILFAYRTSPQATTGDSPFYLLYGREPCLPVDVNLLPPQTDKLSTSIAEHRARIVSQLEEAQQLAKTNTERTQQQMKARYDLKSKPDSYKIGQHVWVYTPKTRKGLSKKLLHRWHGPYRIVNKLSPINFKLRNSANRLISTPVHVNRMKLFYDANNRPIEPPDSLDDNFTLREDEIPDDSFETTPEPQPDFNLPCELPNQPKNQERYINDSQQDADSQDVQNQTSAHEQSDSEVYQIEKILKTCWRKGKKQYFVKWLCFPSEQNSWVVESDMVTPEAELTQPPINYLSTRTKTQGSKSTQSLPKLSQNCQTKQVSYIFSWIYLLIGMLVLITCISIGSAASINIGLFTRISYGSVQICRPLTV